MLLHRTPPKAAAEPDPSKPVKWLRCLQCNKKFPENDFKAHQREAKSPCELVSVTTTERLGRLNDTSNLFWLAPRPRCVEKDDRRPEDQDAWR